MLRSMPKIQKLPSHEAQKIAAGEVVERPSNVVKELVENSIDAGATHITISIENGGKDRIQVIDNGHGMSPEDAILCFEHHATSKISSVNDIPSIVTFGFRGEALSSISSVSHVTLLTKEALAPHGTCVKLEGGIVQSSEPVSCQDGTDITIESLFYNVPARHKFLKKKDTEWRQITLLFQAFCLDYPTIHFKLLHDHKMVYSCPATTTITQRLAQLYDTALTEKVVALNLHNEKQNLIINGVISTHAYYRYDRSSIFFFVNKRWVKNQGLAKALLKGYLNVLPQGRFPAAFIMISIDPESLDVNIHPRKEDVLFLNPRTIELHLQQEVTKLLTTIAPQKNSSASLFAQPIAANERHRLSPLPFSAAPFAAQPSYKPFDFTPFEPARLPNTPQRFTPSDTAATQTEPEPKIFAVVATQTTINTQSIPLFSVIGQFNTTYIMLEQDGGLVLVDQHAAHERILYEQIGAQLTTVETVPLLFPIYIALPQEEIITLTPYISLLTSHGITIEPFDERHVIITTTPVYLKQIDFAELLRHLLGLITEHASLEQDQLFKLLNEKMQAQIACKAAIKAGDTLTVQAMEELIKNLYTTNNNFCCPHGRPTSWFIATTDIEKKFKRDYQKKKREDSFL